MTGSGRPRRSTFARRKTVFIAEPASRLHRLRAIFAVVAVVAGLAVTTAWFAPRFLDWGQYRSTIEAVASAGLGRPVRIAGPIRLSLLPQATLVAGDVAVPDTGDGASATASQLRLQVALGALLAGRIEPEDLVLREPRMRLPWPLTALVSNGLAPPAGLHARVEDGTLAVGGLQVSAINGELRVDPATGTLSAAGLASVMGRSWQMTGRLGRAGPDGSATLEVSLDGQGSAVGTGGTLSGQVGADGGLAGQISGRGPDLSLLLPAPAQPWKAGGHVKAGSGLVVADDLELDIGGSPARGALAVRLLPQMRLDAALATSRLDLGAWLAPLLRGGHLPLPTGIELTADAAQLAGGVVRHLRTGFEVEADGVTLREAEAELPGRAALHVSGRLAAGQFTGEARVAAPDVPQTLAWLHPAAPAVIDALPPGAWQMANLAAAVTADAGGVALTGLSGDANGARLAGELSVRNHGGRSALSANLHVSGPVLDRWLPTMPAGPSDLADRLAAFPGRFAGFDADVTIAATAPVWRGATFDQLTMEARCSDGALELRRGVLAGPGLSLSLAGSMSAAGRIADGRADVSVAQSDGLANSLPAGWEAVAPLFNGRLTLGLVVSGAANALAVTAATEVSDARIQVNGTADLPGRRWKGSVSLHHPGATRLLYSVGLGDTVAWLGDGSLSLQASADAAPDHLSLQAIEVSAGSLRASGDLALTGMATGHPTLAGKVNAETLPLPAVDPRSNAPWTLAVLRAGDATLAIRAAHLLWGLSPVASDVAATVGVLHGALRVDGLSAHVAGGALTAQVTLDTSSPPRFRLVGQLADAVLDGPLGGAPVDVIAGHLDGSVDLSGTGYSPAGVLATLAGPVKAIVRDGAVAGLDAGRVLTVLRTIGPASETAGGSRPDLAAAQSQVADALRGGATPFTRLELEGSLSQGTLTFERGDVTMPAGSIAATGNLDLPAEAIDAHLALQPAQENAPVIGLRLIGPVAAPSRSPELAGLARWLADR